jgi:hypothetical protein
MPPGDGPAPVAGVGVRPARWRSRVVALAALTLVLPVGPGWVVPAGAAPTGAVPAPAPTTPQASGGATTASGPPGLLLVSQTPWVTSTFDLHLRAGAGAPAPADLGLSVAVYPCLSSVSALTQSLAAATPAGTPVARTTTPLPWSGLKTVDGAVDLALTVTDSSQEAGPLSPSDLTVDLRAGDPDCGAGVYPVHLQLVDTSSGSTVGALTTDLVYVTRAAPRKLQVATVIPLSLTVGPSARPTDAQLLASPGNALARPPETEVAAVTATANALVSTQAAPATVEVGGQTLQALDDTGHGATVQTLSQLSADPTSEFVDAPYTPVDPTALVDAGLPSELTLQLSRSSQLLESATIARSAGAGGGSGPWITGNGLDDATLAQLAAAGYHQVVLPPSAVASSPSSGSSAEPFTINSPHGTGVTALTSNADLSARFTSDPGQPVLVASQLLAEMAQIYFEYPNLTKPRTLVAVPGAGWTPNATEVSTLMSALGSSQILQPVTVGQAATDPVACTTGCHLTTPSPATLPATAIRTQRGRVNSLATAIVPASTATRDLPTQLGDTVLASEAEGLRSAQQRAILHNTGAAVDVQLDQLSLAGDQTVTLAAQRGQIPITIAKAASMPEPVTGTLTLTSDRLLFANGQPKISMPAPLLHATNNFYVNVEARTSGEFKLTIVYQAPSGGLVMTEGLVTVRSDAVSVVGVVLSAGAVVVLGAWWVRTGIRRRRLRRSQESAAPA